MADYFYENESVEFPYCIVPLQIFGDSIYSCISSDAKCLYIMMWNRHSLSRKNGWVDECGRIFIFFRSEEIQKEIHCSHGKAANIVSELCEFGLIGVKNRGQGKPRKIFLKNVFKAMQNGADNQPSDNQPSENQMLDFRKSEALYNENNKIEKNKTEKLILSISEVSNTEKSAMQPDDMMDKIQSEVREQISYADIVDFMPRWTQYADNVVNLITDVYMMASGTLMIAQRSLDVAHVQARYADLRQRHVEYVIERFIGTAETVYNPQAYLRTALYNAPGTVDLSTTQEITSVTARYKKRGCG